MREPEQAFPEPTVGGLILNGEGKMLLVKSNKWGQKYTVAGGHVEVGETMEEALRREIREEVGLDITDVRFLMVQECIFSEEFWKPRHFVFLDFVCQSKGEPKVDGREVQECLWVEPKAALDLDLDSFTRRMVEEYIRRAV